MSLEALSMEEGGHTADECRASDLTSPTDGFEPFWGEVTAINPLTDLDVLAGKMEIRSARWLRSPRKPGIIDLSRRHPIDAVRPMWIS
jgi:hypothetical protein